MSELSPYVIRLSSAEEAELRRRVAKCRLPYFEVQRAKMMLYSAQGLSNDEIAAWIPDVKWCPFGANASLPIASLGWKSMLVRIVPGLFPQSSSYKLKP